jgi:hypothetical protein
MYRKFLPLLATHVIALGTRRRSSSEKFSTKVSGPGGATSTGSALDVHLENFTVASWIEIPGRFQPELRLECHRIA